MASVVERRLSDGSRTYLVRFRTTDGQQRSKQFKRKRAADAYVSLVEVDRMRGALIDPRLGRVTVDEWWLQWRPTVTTLRASTRAPDAQFYRTHIRPVFGDTPMSKLDRSTARTWVALFYAVDDEHVRQLVEGALFHSHHVSDGLADHTSSELTTFERRPA